MCATCVERKKEGGGCEPGCALQRLRLEEGVIIVLGVVIASRGCCV